VSEREKARECEAHELMLKTSYHYVSEGARERKSKRLRAGIKEKESKCKRETDREIYI
jgi:hypothetical protein